MKSTLPRISSACLLLLVAAGACRARETRRPTEAVLSVRRDACSFGPGDRAMETVGREYPVGDEIPIDHFFVFMQENRSFDHYFGTMPGVDGLPADTVNPDGNGGYVTPFHTSEYCSPDVEHGWDGMHAAWNGGVNDGFVIENQPGGERAMGFLDESDLPYYHALYRTFAMSQRHFCSMLGPTWVNRMYLTSGTSFGLVTNDFVAPETFDAYGDAPYTIFQQLDAIGVEWRVYYSDLPTPMGLYTSYTVSQWPTGRFRKFTQLADDLAAGDVAALTFVEPAFRSSANQMQNDEHPPSNPQKGQLWVSQRIAEIMGSSVWPTSAIILTYDENGGYYDHVPPPRACVPDDYPLVYGDGTSVTNYDVDHYGIRVPLAVVSPFARRGYVSDQVTDHASILRLVQARFDLPALTRRDANAWPLLDLFDFEHPDTSVPSLPPAVIDPGPEAVCAGTALATANSVF